jgi:anti-sigma factor RsiW
MEAPAQHPLSDADLNALLDGEVGAPERAALEQRLQLDPSAQQRLANWRAQRDAIRRLHAGLLQEPIPDALRAAAQQASQARGALWSGFRWGGLAASVLLAFAAGWLSSAQWSGQHSERLVASAQTQPVFARDAALAHAVYTPEQRHPVEVTAAEQAHLVQWLSKRTGRALKVPDLSAQAYQLVGGRLLPGDRGARAQFMFESTQSGPRITLYMGAVGSAGDPTVQPVPSSTPRSMPAPDQQETAFRFSQDGTVNSFYWVDQGFGYALSGTLTRGDLLTLARVVYQQL